MCHRTVYMCQVRYKLDHVHPQLKAVIISGLFVLNFHIVHILIFAHFFYYYFRISHFCFQTLESYDTWYKYVRHIIRVSVRDILPSVKFPNLENMSCFSCFSWKEKRGKSGKKGCSIKNGPYMSFYTNASKQCRFPLARQCGVF